MDRQVTPLLVTLTEEVTIFCLPRVALGVTTEYVLETVSAIDTTPLFLEGFDEESIDSAWAVRPATGSGQILPRKQQGTPGEQVVPSLPPGTEAPQGHSQPFQVDELSCLPNECGSRVLPCELEVHAVVGSIVVIVVHLRDELSGSGGGGSVEHVTEGSLRRLAQDGVGGPQVAGSILGCVGWEGIAVKGEDTLEAPVLLTVHLLDDVIELIRPHRGAEDGDGLGPAGCRPRYRLRGGSEVPQCFPPERDAEPLSSERVREFARDDCAQHLGKFGAKQDVHATRVGHNNREPCYEQVG